MGNCCFKRSNSEKQTDDKEKSIRKSAHKIKDIIKIPSKK